MRSALLILCPALFDALQLYSSSQPLPLHPHLNLQYYFIQLTFNDEISPTHPMARFIRRPATIFILVLSINVLNEQRASVAVSLDLELVAVVDLASAFVPEEKNDGNKAICISIACIYNINRIFLKEEENRNVS